MIGGCWLFVEMYHSSKGVDFIVFEKRARRRGHVVDLNWLDTWGKSNSPHALYGVGPRGGMNDSEGSAVERRGKTKVGKAG